MDTDGAPGKPNATWPSAGGPLGLLEDVERASGIGVWMWEPATDELWSTAGSRDIYGLDPSVPLTADLVFSRIHPDDQPAMGSLLLAMRQRPHPARLEFRLVHPTRGVRRVRVDVGIREEAGRTFVLGVARDLSELDEAGRSAVSELYRTIVESTEEGIWILDSGGRTSFVNPRMAEMIGYRREEMLGRPVADFCDPAGASQTEENLERRQRGVREIHDFVLQHKDGHEVHTLMATSPLHGDNDAYTGALALVTDVTHRREEQEAVTREREALQRIDKLATLGTLVSGVAHEVNNPNHHIMLTLPLLKRFFDDAAVHLDDIHTRTPSLTLANLPWPEVREEVPLLLDQMAEGAERIRRIIHELRDFTRGVAGESPGPFSINEVVDAALPLLLGRIKKATDRFEVVRGEGIPAVRGSLRSLEHVLVNLVLNACEALSHRTDRLRVSTSWNAAAGRVCVRVEDEGRGIPGDHLRRVFEPFYSSHPHDGGSGLGLAVARRIVQDHGGELRLDSREGAGTTATVLLPPAEASAGGGSASGSSHG